MYRILNSNTPDPFLKNYAFFYPVKLDVEKMTDATSEIIGTRDFKSFMASGGQVKSTVRTIYSAEVFEESGKIIFEVCGNGFLYNMVRIMAGTLACIGAGRITEPLSDIIKSCDRGRAGITAPPQGLYMKKVYYGEQ